MIIVFLLSLVSAEDFPLSKNISPCQDFYEYVCAEKSKSFKLREDRGIHLFSFSGLSEALLEKKKAYLAELSERSPLNPREASIQNLYMACMSPADGARDESAKIDSLKKQMSAISDRDQFTHFLSKQILKGETSFIDFHAEPHFQNPRIWDFYFGLPLLALPEKSYYENEKLVKEYEDLVFKFFLLIGFKDAHSRAERVIDFQKKFAQASPSQVEWRQIWVTPSKIDRKTLLNRFPHLGLNALLAGLPNSTMIRFPTPRLYEFLEKSLSELPLDDLKSIYLFHSLYGSIDDSNPSFQQERYNFSKKYLGAAPVRPERNERCNNYIMGTLGRELDFELSKQIFPDFPSAQVKKLVRSVRLSILNSLEKNSWLSPSAKAEAIKKIKTAQLQLGLPESDYQWDFQMKTKLSKDSPFENDRKIVEAMRKKEIRKFQKMRDLKIWDMSPMAVNASYDPQGNKFVLPAGILQPPFFNARAQEVSNLGGIGSIIGHELGHAIDDQGSRFDSAGLMRSWMNTKDLSLFAEKSEPLLKQFETAGYIGKLTLGENIGDLVGVSFALKAALPNSSSGGLGKADTKRAQDFFIQYARIWCAVVRPEFSEANKKVNVHAQPKSRVNEQVKNQALFQKVFECKDQDPMVLPASGRAQIW